MLIPRRVPIKLKPPREEDKLGEETEKVVTNIQKVSGDLKEDISLIDNLAEVTNMEIRNRLNLNAQKLSSDLD